MLSRILILKYVVNAAPDVVKNMSGLITRMKCIFLFEIFCTIQIIKLPVHVVI